jgi:ribonuclease J
MDGTPGVDLILPDIAWLAERADRLEAIFITHAHEDHVGALGHLLSPFPQGAGHARALYRGNIATPQDGRGGAGSEAMVQVAPPWPDTVTGRSLHRRLLPTSHSIPESSALVIDSPEGRVVHSGDFKIDPDPRRGRALRPRDVGRDRQDRRPGADLRFHQRVFAPCGPQSESDLPEPITRRSWPMRAGWSWRPPSPPTSRRLKTLAEAAVRRAGLSA